MFTAFIIVVGILSLLNVLATITILHLDREIKKLNQETAELFKTKLRHTIVQGKRMTGEEPVISLHVPGWELYLSIEEALQHGFKVRENHD